MLSTILTTHTYDALSRETSVSRPNPASLGTYITTIYTWGINKKTANTEGKIVNYGYDPLNHVLTEGKVYEGGTATLWGHGTKRHNEDLEGNGRVEHT